MCMYHGSDWKFQQNTYHAATILVILCVQKLEWTVLEKKLFPDCEEEKKFYVKTFCLGLQYVKMKSMVKLKIFWDRRGVKGTPAWDNLDFFFT